MSALSCLVPACSRSEPDPRIQAEYDPATGKLSQLTYDSDGNGVPDRWSYMDGATLLRIELDQDEDGLVDRWEYFGADRQLEKVGISRSNDGIVDSWAFASPDDDDLDDDDPDNDDDNDVERVDVSTRRDGVVDRREYYENGQLVRAEQDTDANGLVDKWETFSGGVLTSAAFDTEGLGQPTRRLVYGSDGGLQRIESGSPLDNPQFQRSQR